MDKAILNLFPKKMKDKVTEATKEDCGQGYAFYNVSVMLDEGKTAHIQACGREELKWCINVLAHKDYNQNEENFGLDDNTIVIE